MWAKVPGYDLYIFSTGYKEELLSEGRKATYGTIVTYVVFGGVIFGVLLISMMPIVKRMKEQVERVKRFGEGDLTVEFEVRGKDELTQVEERLKEVKELRGFEEAYQEAKEGGEKYIEYEYNGEKKYTVWAKVPGYDLYIFSTGYKEELLSEGRKATYGTIVTYVVFGGVIFGVLLISMMPIVKRMK
ncbi:HAMP domain-containing protein, partial [Thermotoga sp.]|uniref:HAMP domain-containing protein n=1 Tax=Thermotoga sp. TaxID=28240 RepID=UPI00345ACC31